MVQVLDRLAETRGRPEELVLDNGPEFIGRALDQRAYGRGVRLHFEAWFVTLADARRIIEAWRQDYNTARPHSALGYLTPEEFEQKQLAPPQRSAPP